MTHFDHPPKWGAAWIPASGLGPPSTAPAPRPRQGVATVARSAVGVHMGLAVQYTLAGPTPTATGHRHSSSALSSGQGLRTART